MKLSRTFIRKIKGLPNFFKELQYFDRELYEMLSRLRDMENIEELGLYFMINEKYSNKEIELIPNGSNILVTRNNVVKYIYKYADYKMNI